jgi:hypothetical protein
VGGGEFGGIEEMAVGEQLGANKPWVGTLKKFKDTGFDGYQQKTIQIF